LQGVALVALNNLVLLFWKPWAGAYAGEKGKNLARKEDLNEILAEVRAMTITQKEIEAKVSNEALDRQWIWNQKRDLYTKVVDVGQRLTEHYGDLADAVSVEEQRIAHQKLDADLSELYRLSAFATIFGTQDCCKALRQFFSQEAEQASQEVTKHWAVRGEGRSVALVATLTAEAKREFGLE